MEKKLTIEHVAPYLGHQLQFYGNNNGETYVDTMTGLSKSGDAWFVEGLTYHDYLFAVKPILKPLSWLTKEIEHNRERFTPIDRMRNNFGLRLDEDSDMYFDYYSIGETDSPWTGYRCMNQLIKWHFDVFDLISAGLAIEEGGQR